MILLNGGEIFQRREKNQRQRGSDARLTLGDQRQAGKEETHKICGTDERRTSRFACGFGGRKGSGD
jgi:hypothetical protein